jgi:hypothetical protein
MVVHIVLEGNICSFHFWPFQPIDKMMQTASFIIFPVLDYQGKSGPLVGCQGDYS